MLSLLDHLTGEESTNKRKEAHLQKAYQEMKNYKSSTEHHQLYLIEHQISRQLKEEFLQKAPDLPEIIRN